MRLYDSMSLISLLAICLLQTTYIGYGFDATTLISALYLCRILYYGHKENDIWIINWYCEWYESNITKLNCNDIDDNIYVVIGKP